MTIFDSPPEDPFGLFDSWMADAARSEVNDPNAMALATADDDALPNVRMVLLKGVDARGFVFYTNLQSKKGNELQSHPQAALCFHWKSLQRQVRVRGPVSAVDVEEADAYYASRSRESRLGAWASQQSRTLEDRAELDAAYADMEARFAGRYDIARPPHWSGRRITPLSIEFWQDGNHRLHDRLVYARPAPDAAWRTQRLYP